MFWGLIGETVKKHLLDRAPATDKEHMKRQRKGLRSTKEKLDDKLQEIETANDNNHL